jgi:hypothetical protein
MTTTDPPPAGIDRQPIQAVMVSDIKMTGAN